MKKFIWIGLSVFLTAISYNATKAQIVCVYCYQQNDSISDNVNNLLLNGGMENHNCIPNNWFSSSYCPNSAYYNCDISNWICTGGGTSTYADVIDVSYFQVVEGTYAVYFGNYYCKACSSVPDDTSCLINTDCTTSGIPSGFPNNDPVYGGPNGISLEQTVNGLMVGSTYVLEFWVGGETAFNDPGLFGVDLGFGYTFLRNTNPLPITGIGTRYIIEFNATSTSHTIKFTNWGHICGSCTELTLDDVRLYTLAELSSVVPPCAGAAVTAIFTAPNTICPGTCTDFTNLSTNATSFVWNFPGANPSVSTDMNPTGICYNTPGNYPVTLIASNANSSDTLTLNNYITVYPWPAAQGILQSGDTLIANQGAVSYQWYHNGNIIPGATDYFYVAPEGGNYNVVATDINGCEVEAAIFDVVAAVSPLSFGERSGLRLYPNPVKDKLEIRNLNIADGVVIKIYNTAGTEIHVPALITSAHDKNITTGILDVSGLSPGTYILEITSQNTTLRNRFIKQ